MRKLFTILFIALSFGAQAQLMTFRTLSDLKQVAGADGAFAYVSGADSFGDGKGGVYIFDSTSEATADNYNMVALSVPEVTIGRWRRANQNMLTYVHGTLFRIGALKIFYGTGTVGSNGQVVVNLTTNNVSTGTAMFTQVMFANSTLIAGTSASNDMTTGEWTTTSANQKTVTFTFKRNVVAIGNIASIGYTPNGTAIRVFIVGI